MHREVSPASADREALELAIAQAEAQPAGPAAAASLSASYERLSELCEQAGDFAAALRHHRQFHHLSLLSLKPDLLAREALMQSLGDLVTQPPKWLGSGLCLVALEADGPAGGTGQQAQLAELLRRQCRPEDLIARQGRGNGLLLALTDLDLASARKVCERVRTSWPQHGGGGSLSMGLSAWRGPADELTRLLERVENALLAARRAGGNCLRSGAA
jgi:hypothetical protein